MACSPLDIFLCLHFPSPLSRFPGFVHLESWFLSYQLDRSHPTANELLIFSLELIPVFSQLPWHFESVVSLRNSIITESWEKFISDLIQSPHFADENTPRSGLGVGRWLRLVSFFFFFSFSGWFLLRGFSSCLAALWSCRVCAFSLLNHAVICSWALLKRLFGSVFFFFKKQLTFYLLQSDSEYLHS